MARLKFRDWYVARHGDWPGVEGERHDDIIRRLADGMADYVDEVVAELDEPPTSTAARHRAQQRQAMAGKEPSS